MVTGIIADIWSPVVRGPAMTWLTASVFVGPVLGPVLSAFILYSKLSWRWIFWVIMIFSGVCTPIAIAFLPETSAPVIFVKKAKRLRKQDPIGNKDLYADHEKGERSFNGLASRTILRPFTMFALEPILVLITIYLSIIYGLLYACKCISSSKLELP